MWHTIWDVPVFAGIPDKLAEIQDKSKDTPTQTKPPICSVSFNRAFILLYHKMFSYFRGRHGGCQT